MDLNTWTGKNYEPPFFVGLMVSMGAKRYRCEYCRINFASFRKRFEEFTFSRWKNRNVGGTVAEGRARAAEEEAQALEARRRAQDQARRTAVTQSPEEEDEEYENVD
jgi:hypothetical protein